MAYNEYANFEHTEKLNGKTYKFEFKLKKDGYSGEVYNPDLRGDNGYFEHEYEKIDNRLIFQESVVQKASLSLFVNVPDEKTLGIFTDIGNASETDFILEKYVNGSLEWTGTVIPEFASVPDDDYPVNLQIVAKDFTFLDDGNKLDLNDNSFKYIVTIADILSDLPYSLDIHSYTHWKNDGSDTDDFLNVTYVLQDHLRNYRGASTDEKISKAEALRRILKPLGIILRQAKGVFQLIQVGALQGSTATRYEYNSSGGQTGSSTVNIETAVDDADRYFLPTGTTKLQGGLKRLQANFAHKTLITSFNFADSIKHTINSDQTDTTVTDLSTDGNQRVKISGEVEVRVSGQDGNFITGEAITELLIDTLAYDDDAESWTIGDGDIEISFFGTAPTLRGELSITTNQIPSGLLADLIYRMKWGTVSAGTIDEISFNNFSAQIINDDVTQDNASIDLEYFQAGAFSREIDVGEILFGDGVTSYSKSALKYLSTNLINTSTWYREGSVDSKGVLELYFEEIMSLQRGNRELRNAELWGAYNAFDILTRNGKRYFFLGGVQTGDDLRWNADLLEHNFEPDDGGTDTYQEIPITEGATTSATTGSSGSSSTPTSHSDLSDLDADDHSQYVHLENARVINAVHTFNNGAGFGALPSGSELVRVAGQTFTQSLSVNTGAFAGSEVLRVSGESQFVGETDIDITGNQFRVIAGSPELVVNGASGAIGIGAEPDDDVGLLLDPLPRAVTANADYDRLKVTNSGQVTIASGTTSTHVVTAQFDEPNINLAGTGSVTQAITVYIPTAPTEGDENYALFVESGLSRLNGGVNVNGTLLFNSGQEQNLGQDQSVTFATVNTGQGNNELYAMNQAVRTSDSPEFAGGQYTGRVDFGGSLEQVRIYNNALSGDNIHFDFNGTKFDIVREDISEPTPTLVIMSADFSSGIVDFDATPTVGGTNLTTTSYISSNYYNQTAIENFFDGTTAITGYNKSNWDTAYSWGDHSVVGYTEPGVAESISAKWTFNGGIEVGTELTVGVTALPSVTNTYDLGSGALQFRDVYSEEFYMNGGLVATRTWVTTNIDSYSGWNLKATDTDGVGAGTTINETETVTFESVGSDVSVTRTGNTIFIDFTGDATTDLTWTPGSNLMSSSTGTNATISEFGSALDITAVLNLANSLEQVRFYNGSVSGDYVHFDFNGTTFDLVREDVSVPSTVTIFSANFSSGIVDFSSTPTVSGTDLTTTTYVSSNYYNKTAIDNFFDGTTAITGYNKSNWDTAFSWGDHASAGYTEPGVAESISAKWTFNGGIEVGTELTVGVTALPSANNTYDLGSGALQFRDVYSEEFYMNGGLVATRTWVNTNVDSYSGWNLKATDTDGVGAGTTINETETVVFESVGSDMSVTRTGNTIFIDYTGSGGATNLSWTPSSNLISSSTGTNANINEFGSALSVTAVLNLANSLEQLRIYNGSVSGDYFHFDFDGTTLDLVREDVSVPSTLTPLSINFSSGIVDFNGTPTVGGTDLTTTTYISSNYYNKTAIENFFDGTTAITGYNNSNWDTAYSWGNHASQNYAVTTGDTFTGLLTISTSSNSNFRQRRTNWDSGDYFYTNVSGTPTSATLRKRFYDNSAGAYTDIVDYNLDGSVDFYGSVTASGQVDIGSSLVMNLTGNDLKFNRASSTSYIRQSGIGGTIRFTVSNASADDTNAFQVNNDGRVIFYQGVLMNADIISNADDSFVIGSSTARFNTIHTTRIHSDIIREKDGTNVFNFTSTTRNLYATDGTINLSIPTSGVNVFGTLDVNPSIVVNAGGGTSSLTIGNTSAVSINRINILTDSGQYEIGARGSSSDGSYYIYDKVNNRFNFKTFLDQSADFYGNLNVSGDLDVSRSSSGDVIIDIINSGAGRALLRVRATSGGDAITFYDGINGDVAGGDYTSIGQKNDGTFELRTYSVSNPIEFIFGSTNRYTFSNTSLTINHSVTNINGNAGNTYLSVKSGTTFDDNAYIQVENRSSDHGRAGIQLLAQAQGTNDSWSSSSGRSRIEFKRDYGKTGTFTSQYAIQHHLINNNLGIVNGSTKLQHWDSSGNVTLAGTHSASDHEDSSDIRIKSRIMEEDPLRYAKLAKKLYSYNKEGYKGRQVGLIAQEYLTEAPEILGEMDHETYNKIYTMSGYTLGSIALAGVNKVNEKTDRQTKLIASLRSRIAELEGKLTEAGL